MRKHPVVLECPVNYRNFDLFDSDRWLVDSENTRALTRCRAESAGELRKIVGRVKSFDSLCALVAPGKVIPLWNQVAKRATLVAKRDAAVHASAGLLLYNSFVTRFVNLFPVTNANSYRATLGSLALCHLKKSPWISHRSPPESSSRPHRHRGRGFRRVHPCES